MKQLFPFNGKTYFATMLITVLLMLQLPLIAFAAKWSDSGAYNISWYNKNQTEFYISTPQELAGVAYLVNNGFTTFKGQAIYLTANIDLSNKDWMPIGMESTDFNGVFDGNGYSISNIELVQTNNTHCGFWEKTNNAILRNFKISGTVSTQSEKIGLVVGQATNTDFENIEANVSIILNVSKCYNKDGFEIGGIVGNSKSCKYLDIKSNFNVDITLGDASGLNLINKNMGVKVGGIVGYGYTDYFEKCQTTNDFNIGIYSYTKSSNNKNYNVYCGGIVGHGCSVYKNDNTRIIACFSTTNNFKGCHYIGYTDDVYFSYGGITGYCDEYVEIQNCVSINSDYLVRGHSKPSGTSRYFTSSRFSGISYIITSLFGGCYSNENIVRSTSFVDNDINGAHGSTAYSSSQMNSQAFVDELNMYGQLVLDKEYWTLDRNGKLSLIDENAEVEVSEVKLSQYSAELQEDETLQLIANVEPSDATNQDIIWASSSHEIASVSSAGLITAIKEGTTTVTATASNSMSASCTVTVKKKALPVCDKPTISIVDGKLVVSSETTDGVCLYSITSPDFKSGEADVSGFVELSGQYNIRAYATAVGYQDSEAVEAVLVWVNPTIEGNNILNMEAKKAVVIKSAGGQVVICGTEQGEHVALFTLDGKQIASTKAADSETILPCNLPKGEIVIVRYGDKAIKITL